MDAKVSSRNGPEAARDSVSHVASPEMAARISSFDWTKMALGTSQMWSPALRMMVRILLTNRFPMLLWWGPQYVSIYNDAYREVLGTKHPWALGQPVSECWKEIWHILKPLIDRPFHGGPATWDEDILLEINRHGFIEETHFTIAYSPVPDETVSSGIGGVLATVHEITSEVLSERRLAVLHDSGTRSTEAKTVAEACAIAVESLNEHPLDIPFAALYLVGSDRKKAQLAGAAGTAADEPSCPPQIDLEGNQSSDSVWPLAEVLKTDAMVIVGDISHRPAGRVPSGPWTDPPNTAVIVPISSKKGQEPLGFLVVGISARLKLDHAYSDFLNLVSSQITASIVNAREYEEEKQRTEVLAAQLRSEKALRDAEKALNAANERFRAMADTAPVLIWENDANGAVFVNQYFLAFHDVSFEVIQGWGGPAFSTLTMPPLTSLRIRKPLRSGNHSSMRSASAAPMANIAGCSPPRDRSAKAALLDSPPTSPSSRRRKQLFENLTSEKMNFSRSLAMSCEIPLAELCSHWRRLVVLLRRHSAQNLSK